MRYSELLPFQGTLLAICKNNVGRSQMMVGFLRDKLNGPIMGAGVVALKEKYQNKPHQAVVRVMADRHIDISSQPITQLEEKFVFPDMTVIILCEPEIVPMYVFKKARLVLCSPVEDPYDNGLQTLAETADKIQVLAGLFVLSLLGEAEFPNRNLKHIYDDQIFYRKEY